MNDFDTSELRWWRCITVGPNGEIRTFVVSIDPDNVYKEFVKLRNDLIGRGLKFVEAKPISADEWKVMSKLLQFKRRKQAYLRGLTGRYYTPVSRRSIAVSAVLLFLLVLLLVYLH
jgi:hypothetical protein